MPNSNLQFSVESSSLCFRQAFGPAFQVSFIRTLRIPDDDKQYCLPPGFGPFPLRRVADYADKVPKKWLTDGGVFLPIYQREAMWLSFSGPNHALKVAAGGINALSGQEWTEELQPSNDGQQDYMVCPQQPWLDGFNTGEGVIRQFVAMPMGAGYTVEAQITGEEKKGGLQLTVYPSKKDAIMIRRYAKQDQSRSYPFLPTEVHQALCKRLLDEGHLDQEQIDQVKEKSSTSGDSIPASIRKMKLLDPSLLDHLICKCNAEALGIDFVDLDSLELDPEVSRLVPEDLCHRYLVMPISQQDENLLTLAMFDPADIVTLDDINLITGFNIVPVQATENALLRAIHRYFPGYDLFDVEETVKDISAADFGSLDFAPVQEFGLASGGQMSQEIYPDPYGIETWDQNAGVSCHVHLVDIFTWSKITGEHPPSTPVNAKAYTEAGLPWYDIYNDTHLGDLTPSEILAEVKSMAQLDQECGVSDSNNDGFDIPDAQVVSFVKSDKPLGQG